MFGYELRIYKRHDHSAQIILVNSLTSIILEKDRSLVSGGFLFVGWAHRLPQKESDRVLSIRHKIFRPIRYGVYLLTFGLLNICIWPGVTIFAEFHVDDLSHYLL